VSTPVLCWSAVCQVVHDAVLFGVIAIVYDFEATSLECLLHRLDACLHGRTARSAYLPPVFASCSEGLKPQGQH